MSKSQRLPNDQPAIDRRAFIAGRVVDPDTREKFLDKRLELALHEWARFKANDSLECRNCHSAESMDITRQSPRASAAHQRFLFTAEKTCIDCHKGIAHKLPDMQGVPGWQ
jgi:cytochrome c-type protein NapC